MASAPAQPGSSVGSFGLGAAAALCFPNPGSSVESSGSPGGAVASSCPPIGTAVESSGSPGTAVEFLWPGSGRRAL